MVEVFKTNVQDPGHAGRLTDLIHAMFTGYRANFDLDDCDRILRVECATGVVPSSQLIDLLTDLGFYAEVLQDNILPAFRLGEANVISPSGL